MTVKQPPDTLPVYSIKQIMRLRSKLVDRLARQFAGITLDAADITVIIDILRDIMSPSISTRVISQTVDQLIGTTLSAADIAQFCWLLAGNQARLRRGEAVARWQSPGVEEWVPLQVTRVDPAQLRNDNYNYMFRLRVLAGAASGLLVTKRFPARMLMMLSQVGGFTGTRSAHNSRPYQSAYQFVSLRMFGWLDPDLVRDRQPMFHSIRFPSGCLAYNQEILSKRYRHAGFKCPQNFTHDCHVCTVGMQQCEMATHRENYLYILCSVCNKMGWADPEVATLTCVSCWRHQQSVSK